MGLLEDFGEFIKTPEGMGLLSAVAGGLANANRGTPVNNIGRAGLAGVIGYGNALDRQERALENEQQRQLRKMQMDEAARRLAEQQKTETFFTNVIPSLLTAKPEYQALSNGLGPTIANAATIQAMPKAGTIDANAMYRAMLNSGIPGLATTGLQGLTKQDEPITLADGGMLVTKSGQKLLENPKVPKEESKPWYVLRDPSGRTMIDPAYAELEKTKASFGRPPAQPMAPVAYQDPATGRVIWGTITDARGKPAANFSPAIQGAIAGAKEAAKTEGEERTKAALDAPRVIDNATTALKYSEELLKHPGFGQAVGKSSMLGLQKIPGTEGRDFMNRLDQLKGGAFLEAFNTLKGGGQITEVEGKKATDAIARMDNSTSEDEFKAAVKDYQDVIRKGMNRAKMKAKPMVSVQQQQNGVKFLGFE